VYSAVAAAVVVAKVAEAAAAVVEVVEGVAALNGVVLDNSVVAVVAIGNELCDSPCLLTLSDRFLLLTALVLFVLLELEHFFSARLHIDIVSTCMDGMVDGCL